MFFKTFAQKQIEQKGRDYDRMSRTLTSAAAAMNDKYAGEIDRLRGTLQAIMDRSEPDSWAYIYAKRALEQ